MPSNRPGGAGTTWSKLVMRLSSGRSAVDRGTVQHAKPRKRTGKKSALCHNLTCDVWAKLTDLATCPAKLFLGHRLRRLRRDRELSQTDMAHERSAISPSYLNHLERNQRPVTAALLLKLAELYDIDVRAFAAGGGDPHRAGRAGRDLLRRACSPTSACRATSWPSWPTMRPSVADAIARLYAALQGSRPQPEPGRATAMRAALVTPENWVRDYIQQHRNHYPELEEARRDAGRRAERSACRWPSRCGGG